MYSQGILFPYRQGVLESGMAREASLITMECRVKLRTTCTNISLSTAKYCMRCHLTAVADLVLLQFIYSCMNIKSRVICPDLEVSNPIFKKIQEHYRSPRNDGTKTSFFVLLPTST